jgi:hypothetical protein
LASSERSICVFCLVKTFFLIISSYYLLPGTSLFKTSLELLVGLVSSTFLGLEREDFLDIIKRYLFEKKKGKESGSRLIYTR